MVGGTGAARRRPPSVSLSRGVQRVLDVALLQRASRYPVPQRRAPTLATDAPSAARRSRRPRGDDPAPQGWRQVQLPCAVKAYVRGPRDCPATARRQVLRARGRGGPTDLAAARAGAPGITRAGGQGARFCHPDGAGSGPVSSDRARQILRGAVPYRDAWDPKPPGVFYTQVAVLAVVSDPWRVCHIGTLPGLSRSDLQPRCGTPLFQAFGIQVPLARI